ncbi:hypothetical protein JRQ81_011043 [Phrynocephalus forsythii]|uniref:Prion/Doppel protein beta-ribbon domain-containing protein n=1 Tax=Phrynocephalus forsythii TaxID=171643 RepID=A0A9Q0X7E1_9SAUR|nr:hypothetical protein JRQ81_011043 [Phrynocephalus forsythii]
MGKCLVTCSIVILFILLQTDINVSSSRSGSSRPSGGSHRGSSHRPSRPAHRPSRPAQQPSRPVHQPSRPVHRPSKPVHKPVKPVETPIKPANIPVKPVQNERVQPVKPVQNPAPPQHNPANPPPYNPAYQPHNPVNPPPQNPAYPPHNPANPPPYNPAYQPHNPANPPPQNPAYPPHNPANPPPHNPVYPPHNPANPPPQNPAYPPHNPLNPPIQNPAYPPRNPAYPPTKPWNPGGSHYNVKPWKPKSPKTNMKHVAGAALGGAAAGALGGFLLGRAMSNMHFQFNNHDEERWWHENRDRYSNQVYFPKYEQPVPEDIFVKDCWNTTVREFIAPTGNKTADEMETRVVTRVVQEMCIEQYRSFSRQAGGGSVGPQDGNPPDPSQPVMKFVEGEPITGSDAEEAGGYLFGSAVSTTRFHFNNSDEERWWEENRSRFTSHVFHPNYSQPVLRDVFVSDCVNATMRAYEKPSGNQTANEMEMETRVLARVVPEICAELFCGYLSKAGAGGGLANNCENRPLEPTVPVKLAMKYMVETGFGSGAVAGTATKASGDGTHSRAGSSMHDHIHGAFLLANPSVLSALMLSACLLLL